MRSPTRREVVLTAAGAAAVTFALPRLGHATAEAAMAEVDRFTGGAEASASGIDLITPEIAENGNTVPIAVTVDTPQSADEHVRRIIVLADGNPSPGVATFQLSPHSGAGEVSTRMRMAKTQNLVAVAEMNDGSFRRAEKLVKVTIGGCGG